MFIGILVIFRVVCCSAKCVYLGWGVGGTKALSVIRIGNKHVNWVHDVFCIC